MISHIKSKNVKVFFTVLNEKQNFNTIELELNKKSKIFRKYLAGFLEIKYVPKLKFLYDDTLLHEQIINKLLSIAFEFIELILYVNSNIMPH